jgi:hypothetical protein
MLFVAEKAVETHLGLAGHLVAAAAPGLLARATS